MYNSGYKVATYTSSRKRWVQEGTNIEFKKAARCKYADRDGNECSFNRREANSLSFYYTFRLLDDYVYFAYCIPYSYSYLLHSLHKLEKKNEDILNIDYKHKSTGGLKLPILTITSKEESSASPSEYQNKQQKPTCLIIGRLHPG